MRCVFIGNFEPPFSTENDLRKALVANRIDVIAQQEQHFDWVRYEPPDDATFVLWVTTYSNAPEATYNDQALFLARMHKRGLPTVAAHLDLWWGLKEHGREERVRAAPFFRCDLVCTADGGHDEDWAREGVNHRWFPPGVSEFECVPGTPRDEYRSEIAFVGSWSPEYHRESRHRHELVRWLRETYGERVRFWPRPGEPGIRGKDLRDLYRSTTIAIGDSCLVGDGAKFYASDRCPESMGRGVLFAHPYVEGVIPGLWEPGEHLLAWEAYDWEALRALVDDALAQTPEWRASIAEAGRLHTIANHSYSRRMAQLVDLMRSEGVLS